MSKTSSSTAILLGSIIIAISMFISQSSGSAQAFSNGPYQLMHHSNTTASVGVFKLDTNNGEVSYCFLNRNNTLACSSPVK